MASLSRGSSLGDEKDLAISSGAVGRGVFFVATSVAYAAFPMICTLPLFSRELARRFREAQVLVVVLTGLLFAVVVAVVWIDPGNINFSAPRPLTIVAATGWSMFALSLIPMLFYVAHNSRIGLVMVIPALVMGGAQMAASSALSLAVSFLITSAVTLIIVLVPVLWRIRPIVHPYVARDEVTGSVPPGEVVVVIPSYNSGLRGPETALAVHRVFDTAGVSARVIAVSDGSTDESVAAFGAMTETWFQHVVFTENRGKGAALRAGFEQANCDVVGFLDADGDIPPEVLVDMFLSLRRDSADVVFGSKWHPNSDVSVSRTRLFISRVQRLVQLVLFRIDISDTQVGAKMYDGRMLSRVLPTLHEDGFSLDLEIFVSAVAHGYTRFREFPISIRRTGGSTVSTRSIVSTAIAVVRIFWRSHVMLAYNAMAYDLALKGGHETT
jgi:hypothetical protein